MKNSTTIISLLILATALLVTGKMLGYDIEWLWAFAPMWLPFAALLLVTFLMLITALGLRALVIFSGWPITQQKWWIKTDECFSRHQKTNQHFPRTGAL